MGVDLAVAGVLGALVLVLLVVLAYALSWAIASGWARGRQAVPPTPDQDTRDQLVRTMMGDW
jgi:hypothetical protein